MLHQLVRVVRKGCITQSRINAHLFAINPAKSLLTTHFIQQAFFFLFLNTKSDANQFQIFTSMVLQLKSAKQDFITLSYARPHHTHTHVACTAHFLCFCLHLLCLTSTCSDSVWHQYHRLLGRLVLSGHHGHSYCLTNKACMHVLFK